MENWTQRILLVRAVLAACFAVVFALMTKPVFAADPERPLIEPDVRPQVVDESLIDTENVELGIFAGLIKIEDFESSMLYRARLAYHFSESLFFELNYAIAEAGETSFEKLGNVQLLSDSDRDYSYYNFGFGYNILPGEAFLTDKLAFNTNFYLVAGAGATEFAGDTGFTANYGAGYQVLLNDWLSMHLTVREHVFDIDVLGETKTGFNTEVSSGLTIFF